MAAQGQAATDLETFKKSEKMMEIWNVLKISAEEGNSSNVLSFESLGTSRQAVFAGTILREQGHGVEFQDGVMIVSL